MKTKILHIHLFLFYLVLFLVYPYAHIHFDCASRAEICAVMVVCQTADHERDIQHHHHQHTHVRGDWQHVAQKDESDVLYDAMPELSIGIVDYHPAISSYRIIFPVKLTNQSISKSTSPRGPPVVTA